MLLEANQSLEEVVVKVLALLPGRSVQQLQREVAQLSRKYSLQAIYKVLERLQAGGVVVRVQKHYSLSMSWALDLVHLGDIIYDGYIANGSLTAASPPLVHRQTWRCYDFIRLANFWPHIRLSMVHHTGEKQIYDWVPHPWFQLVDSTKQGQFVRVAKEGKIRVSAIVGGTTFLDRYLSSMWDKNVFEWSHSRGPFREEMSSYISLVGDYIFTFRLEKACEEELEQLFRVTTSKDAIFSETTQSFFRQRGKFKITVKEDAAKARRLRKKFEDFFGTDL